jgi:hypothetical protein
MHLARLLLPPVVNVGAMQSGSGKAARETRGLRSAIDRSPLVCAAPGVGGWPPTTGSGAGAVWLAQGEPGTGLSFSSWASTLRCA